MKTRGRKNELTTWNDLSTMVEPNSRTVDNGTWGGEGRGAESQGAQAHGSGYIHNFIAPLVQR